MQTLATTHLSPIPHRLSPPIPVSATARTSCCKQGPLPYSPHTLTVFSTDSAGEEAEEEALHGAAGVGDDIKMRTDLTTFPMQHKRSKRPRRPSKARRGLRRPVSRGHPTHLALAVSLPLELAQLLPSLSARIVVLTSRRQRITSISLSLSLHLVCDWMYPFLS
jgi:hypothetical protein